MLLACVCVSVYVCVICYDSFYSYMCMCVRETEKNPVLPQC